MSQRRYLKIQQYGNYAAKALPIPFIYFLYTKNIFQLKSRSILRDFGVILGCIGWTEACEFGLSKFMWMNVESQVKAFGLLKRKEMEGRYKALIPKQRTELQNETDFMDDYSTNEQTATSKA